MLNEPRMKLHLLLILSMLCSYKSQDQSNHVAKEVTAPVEPKENIFMQFVHEIPTYNFPILMSCNYDRPLSEITFTSYENYIPEGGSVVAKLNSNTDFELIVFDFACDYSCPILFSYNSDGIRLDSINLTPGQCGEDMNISSSEWFKIDENISIELIDSTEHYSYLQAEQILDSITVATQYFSINKKGKFNFLSKKSELITEEK